MAQRFSIRKGRVSLRPISRAIAGTDPRGRATRFIRTLRSATLPAMLATTAVRHHPPPQRDAPRRLWPVFGAPHDRTASVTPVPAVSVAGSTLTRRTNRRTSAPAPRGTANASTGLRFGVDEHRRPPPHSPPMTGLDLDRRTMTAMKPAQQRAPRPKPVLAQPRPGLPRTPDLPASAQYRTRALPGWSGLWRGGGTAPTRIPVLELTSVRRLM